ncbi:MAG: hypothetical protein RSF69_03065 [Erysipelotrichaceae bacterium]
MVEIRTIKSDHNTFVGILLKLPHQPIYLITSTHLIIAGAQFDITYFNQEMKQTAIAIMAENGSFEQLLNSKIKYCSPCAIHMGIKKDMLGKEALNLCDAFHQL